MINEEYMERWDGMEGVAYIPWKDLPRNIGHLLEEGAVIDSESLPPADTKIKVKKSKGTNYADYCFGVLHFNCKRKPFSERYFLFQINDKSLSHPNSPYM